MESSQPMSLRKGEYPNHLWIVDHHLLNCLAIDPHRGEIVRRPWLTVVMDDFSRAICGLHLELEPPNSLSITMALRHAMLSKAHPKWNIHGIPHFLRIDRNRVTGMQPFKTICQQFGITLLYASARTPRVSAKIERFFVALENESKIEDIGALRSTKLKSRRRDPSKQTLIEIETSVVAFLVDHYHERMPVAKSAPPGVRWSNEQRTRPIRLVENEYDLDILLPYAKRRVHKNRLQLHGAVYMDSEHVLDTYTGHEVHVFYDPHDMSHVRVYNYANGSNEFICRAELALQSVEWSIVRHLYLPR